MKTNKKILATLLATILAASALTGCGGKPATENSSTKTESKGADTEKTATDEKITFPLAEPVTMKMFGVSLSQVSLDQCKAMEEMEKRTNVKWEIQSAFGADLAEKRNLLLASNQYPDVFMKGGFDQTMLDKYGAQGMFMKLNDLIDANAPNIKGILDESPAIKSRLQSEDGSIYSLPEVSSPSVAVDPYWINTKWLDKLGLKMPTNLDELYTMLKDFKDKDPNGNGEVDEIPMFSANNLNTLLPFFGVNLDGGTNTANVDGKYQYIPSTDKYKEFIKYSRKLYSEGLLDKNTFVNTYDQQHALGQSGDVLGSFFVAGSFLTVGRDRDVDFKALMPFEKGVFPTTTGADVGAFVITDACKNPELAMSWADQWYTEDGGRLAIMGIENESYKINDDGTWSWNEEKADIATLRQQYSIQGTTTMPAKWPDLWFDGMTDKNEKPLTDTRNALVEAGAKPFPTLKLSEADTKSVATIKADIDPYNEQYLAKVVTGEQELDATWDEYQATLKNMGLDQMMKIYTAAYEKATK